MPRTPVLIGRKKVSESAKIATVIKKKIHILNLHNVSLEKLEIGLRASESVRIATCNFNCW